MEYSQYQEGKREGGRVDRRPSAEECGAQVEPGVRASRVSPPMGPQSSLAVQVPARSSHLPASDSSSLKKGK